MNDEIIRAYAQKIQGFAWQKTHHPQDAEDLAQEIFLTLCRMDFTSRQIEHPDAYIWRICSYTWSNFIRKRMRDRKFCTGSEGMEQVASDEDVAAEVADRLARDETYARLYREITYLSRTRREVIRRHYFAGESSRVIGKALGLSDATVRWYLGEGHKRLKERMDMKQDEKIYEPMRLEVYFSGRSLTGDLYGLRNDLLMQNICQVCASRRGLTIEEMAAKLSMSAAFVEDKLDALVHMAYLEPIGNSGRYRTTFFIKDADFALAEAAWLSEHLKPIAHRLYEETHTRFGRIREIGFMGCDMDENYLMWLLVTMAAHAHDCALTNEVPPAPSVPRGDGSAFRIMASWRSKEILRVAAPSAELTDFLCYHGGAGGKCNGNDHMAIQQWDPPICTPLRDVFSPDQRGYFERVYHIIRDDLPLSALDCDIVTFLANAGYVRVENGRPVLLIPYLTASQFDALEEIIEQEIVPAVTRISHDLSREHAAHMATLIPDYVDEDERHFVTGTLYTPNAYTYLLYRDGLLKKPTDEECRAVCTVAWSYA